MGAVRTLHTSSAIQFAELIIFASQKTSWKAKESTETSLDSVAWHSVMVDWALRIQHDARIYQEILLMRTRGERIETNMLMKRTYGINCGEVRQHLLVTRQCTDQA